MDRELLIRKLDREIKARKQAESILETKALELYHANQELHQLNTQLEKQVLKRTSELKESETRYRSLVESASDIIFNVDEDGYFTYINSIGTESFGYSVDEILGKRYVDFVIESHKESLFNYYSRLREDRVQSDYMEFPVYDKNGNVVWIGQNVNLVEDEENGYYYSAVARDITERRNLEIELKTAQAEAIKAQQAEKDFLANMSHEIRTPLNAIIGMSHLLNDTPLDVQQKEYLEILSGSASILQNLISDILDISKIDAGTLEPQLSEIDLVLLCERLVHTLQSKNRDRLVSIGFSSDEKISHAVVSDGQWINQILLNLLSNAEKFTHKGRIDLSIKLVSESDREYTVLFTVKDTGIGLSPEEQEEVFQKFKQADPSIRRIYGGTGLGLAISKKLVELLGGELKVHSIKGQGSQFYFDLNLGKGGLRKDIKMKSGSIADLTPEIGRHNVLIVEDNLMNQKYISSLLSKWNINFKICNNGKEAIEACELNKYDLIFMDLSMPVMDGYTACKRIQEGSSLNSRTTIIALTASTFLSKKQLAMEAGMKDFISKPFTPDQLSFYLKKYLNKSTGEKIDTPFAFSDELDTDVLNDLYGSDVVYACGMFEMFLSIIDGEMQELENICESGNLLLLRKQVHKMKPTFKMVGLSELYSMMEKMEGKEDIEDVQQELDVFKTKLKGKLQVLRIEYRRLKSEFL